MEDKDWGNLLQFQHWLQNGKSLQKGRDVEMDDETDADTFKKLGAKMSLVKMKKIWDDAEQLFQGALMHALYKRVSDLIAASSADVQHVPTTLVPQWQALEASLKGVSDGTLTSLVYETAFHEFPLDMASEVETGKRTRDKEPIMRRETQEEAVERLRPHFEGMLKDSAARALASYEKHVSPAMVSAIVRSRFDPRFEPEPFPGKDITVAKLQSFFGCEEKQARVELYAEWTSYVARWSAFTDEEKGVGTARFWLKQAKQAPTLSVLGSWHSERYTSAIATERANAIGRAMEGGGQRFSMEMPAFQAEMCCRVNGWLVDEVCPTQLRLQQLTCAHLHQLTAALMLKHL